MRQPRAIWLLVLVACFLGGCDGFDLVGKTSLGAPGSPEEGKKFMVEALNYWVGRSKDERVRVFGAPSQCRKLDSAEVCEWKTTRQQVAFNYDTGGIARSWSYRGDYGQFTNANHERVRPTTIATTQASRKSKTEWTHPSKKKDELDRDYFECRELVEKDPKAAAGTTMALRNVSDFVVTEPIDNCLKQRGWMQQ